MKTTLRLTQSQHEALKRHLFPGDCKEAVAFLICGRRMGAYQHVLVVQRVVPIPYEDCSVRAVDIVTWSTDVIDNIVQEIHGKNLALVKVHSHPTGYPEFSLTDDASDLVVFESIESLLGDGHGHASAVMLPDGKMFGRTWKESKTDSLAITLVGADLHFWTSHSSVYSPPAAVQRTAQAFGSGTTEILGGLSIAVVGCSGTGSIVVEQLARLGVGRLVLIDPDRIEEKNLNRILNSSKADAEAGRFKVDVLAEKIRLMGLSTEVTAVPLNLATKEAVLLVAECDAVFGCMDGVEGRHLLNRLASFYSIPYWDVGIRLDSDGNGGIRHIAGAVHYLQPGLSSLLTRKVYSMKSVEAEELRRLDPALYSQQREAGYIRGVDEDRPAVISVNMLFSALCVNDFLARIHSYRNNGNEPFAAITGNLNEVSLLSESEGDFEVDSELLRWAGAGDIAPLLNRPFLS